MIEQLTITTEIRGVVQDAIISYSYYGSRDIYIHSVEIDGERHPDSWLSQLCADDLTAREVSAVKSAIRNHKLQAI